jgi:hypothetical protein
MRLTIEMDNFILKVSFCVDDMSALLFSRSRLLGLPITVSGLAKVAIFTTNVDAENQFD